MTCSLRTKPATTVAGKVGFCSSHRAEAIAATKALGSKAMGRGVFLVYPEKKA